MASDSSQRFIRLHRLATEFAERHRRGEYPTLQEYVESHPELAGEIHEVFPSLVAMEPVQDDRGSMTGSPTTDTSPLLRFRRRADFRAITWLGGALTAVLVLLTVFSLVAAQRMRAIALATEKERIARTDAERANEQVVQERELAETAKRTAETDSRAFQAATKAAEEAKQTAEAAAQTAEARRTQAILALQKAEEDFAKAKATVKVYLTTVSSDACLKAPALLPLRTRLLGSVLEFYQQFLWEHGTDPALRRELAAVHDHVGFIYNELSQEQSADRSYALSLSLYESLAAETPDDREIQDSLAKALYRQGQNERAIAIWEKLVRPDDPRYHADLGNAYNDTASQFSNDRSQVLEFHRKALMIRERLVRLRPYDPDARLGLAASLNQLALQLKGNRNHEALALFRKALEQGEAAYRLDPTYEPTNRFLVTQLDQVAVRTKNAGETEEELAAHRRRIDVLDRRARENPAVSRFDTELVQAIADFLDALREVGRWDEAAKVADRARERIADSTEETPAFFEAVRDFHLADYSLAIARSKAAPGEPVKTEREALAAVNALRQHVLAGWRDTTGMRTDPRTEPLRQRADFNELMARVDELGAADATARNETASLEGKAGARRIITTALEAVAGPLPPGRFHRRILAQARQELARALLDAGQVEEARGPFDAALAERQRLVEEGPASEPLRTELLQSQVSRGDWLAAAGRLEEAGAAWEEALAPLEADFKVNPDRLGLRAPLAEALRQVGDQYGKLGLLAEALRYDRRAFEVDAPATFTPWHQYALLMAEAGDTEGLKALARRVATVKELAEDRRDATSIEWQQWIPAAARTQPGPGNGGQARLVGPDELIWNGIVVALAEHRLGHADAAREALQRADAAADRVMGNAATDPAMRLVKPSWPDWVYFRLLRREAHRTLEGKPIRDSPYDRLFRGRVLYAFGQVKQAETEFAAAVALRPNDVDLLLSRARVFARLGQKDRMAAELAKARELEPDRAEPWIETARTLAELGEHSQAGAAFARAAAIGKGALNPFLEAGWWVAGPCPGSFDRAGPPEIDPDPSRQLPAVGNIQSLRWRAVAATSSTGRIDAGTLAPGNPNSSFYALTYVNADRDRTGALLLRPGAGGDARLWVNGRLAFDGFAAWTLDGGRENWVPVALRAGRNTILLKFKQSSGPASCECVFRDSSLQRAWELVPLGLWAEAADSFGEADRHVPLDARATWVRIFCLYTAGREEESRRAFGELVRQLDRPGVIEVPSEIGVSCLLPGEKSTVRDRWIAPLRTLCEISPNAFWLRHRAANGYFRAGRYAEAEAEIQKAVDTEDQLYFRPLHASILHQVGKRDEALRTLQATEERHARIVRRALTTMTVPYFESWEEELWYQATVREAHRLILGKDPTPSDSEATVIKRAREFQARREKTEDDFARLATANPNQSRLWIDLGRRLAEQNQWNEAEQRFVTARARGRNLPQVWKELGRTYAELGRWDEAEAEFASALDSIQIPPIPRDRAGSYAWFADRHGIDDAIVRHQEVYLRLTQRRPKDLALVARRMYDLVCRGMFPEAAAVQARAVELVPENVAAQELLALLRLRAGDNPGYHALARDLLGRYKDNADPTLAQAMINTLLLVPDAVTDRETIRRWGETASARYRTHPTEAALLLASMLSDYRLGNFDAVASQLANAPRSWADLEASIRGVEAAALARLHRGSEAASALQKARAAFDRLPQPGRIFAPDPFHWWETIRAEILIKEAAGLIPTAPAAVRVESLVREQAAQRQRKARADHLSAQEALALIRLDNGQKNQAETELRTVLADRVKIAAEEPANPAYQADLATTDQQLGRLLAETGKLDEALERLQQAAAIVKTFRGALSRVPAIDHDLASSYLIVGEAARKANRTSDATREFQRVVEVLTRITAANPKSPAADWLILTISHGRLGEMEQSRAACRKAAQLLKPADLDPVLNSLLQKAAPVVGLDRPEAAEVLAAAAGEPPEALTAAIGGAPSQPRAYRERANWYGVHGLWKKAAADLDAADRLQADSYASLQLAAVLVHLGERDRYRDVCRKMLASWSKTTSHFDASNTVKAGMLLADSQVDADAMVPLVQVAVSGDGKYPFMEWYRFSEGLHAYRTGKLNEALAACRDSRRGNTQNHNEIPALTADNLAVEAMSQQRLGKAADARQSLGQAKQLLEDRFSLTDDRWWHDWLVASVLYREAEMLIEESGNESKK
jgi:tetratricopeptide (TPR) repeat protein